MSWAASRVTLCICRSAFTYPSWALSASSRGMSVRMRVVPSVME
nr:hypothetical protein [Human alphaherpesvirus 2]